MQIFIKTQKLIEYLKKQKDKSIGFVPTMGALHNGHLSLIKKSISQNEMTIVSIFVNPTQFLEGEDLDKYPRKIEADKKICSLAGVDVLFLPSKEEVYFDDEIKICTPSKKGYILEGYHRPGHFNGVLQIVLKLLNITKPTRAYFGKKDAQQLYLVKKMAKELFLDVSIIECDIVRDSDGLALSSRNSYLTKKEREDALLISSSLKEAAKLIYNGERETKNIKEIIYKRLEPLKIDYVEIVNKDFDPLETIMPQNTLILIAAYVGTTRLIDNIEV